MQRRFHKRDALGAAALALMVACGTGQALAQAPPQQAPAASAAKKPAARSSLPAEALEKARQAEKALAANQPDQAITILRDLDKQHPGNPALSLRLAEIHDTLNRYGHALFYYRRYVKLAGPKAREMAAARVQTLELMAGIEDDVAAVASELGEQTVPVATPAPKVERMIAAEAKDGTLVPLTSEEDLKNIRSLTAKAAASPAVTPTHTPIVIPETLAATPTARATAATSPARPTDSMAISGAEATPAARPPGGAVQIEAAPRAPSAPGEPVVHSTPQQRQSVYTGATPAPPDEDALLAKAFVKADSPAGISIDTPAPKEVTVKATPEAEKRATPKPRPTQTPQLAPKTAVTAQPTVVPSLGDAVAFTKSPPVSDSPRGASFFHVTKSSSSYAQVVLLNDLPQGVVTMSIVPPDDKEVLSAILLPGESKTLYVPPGRYAVTANASTTDYSPITLMNTQFQFSFQAGRQYTRRVTQESLQRMN